MKPFRLVDRIRGDGRRQGVTDDYMTPGRVIIGAPLPRVDDGELDGVPPVAVSKGWGDMSWLRR